MLGETHDTRQIFSYTTECDGIDSSIYLYTYRMRIKYLSQPDGFRFKLDSVRPVQVVRKGTSGPGFTSSIIE